MNLQRICFTAVLTSLSLLFANGCAFDSGHQFKPPEAVELTPAPLEVDIYEIWQEFQQDPGQAKQKYQGQRLSFRNVTAESVKTTFLDARAYDNIWIRTGQVEFRPRYYQDFNVVLPGFTCDLVGDCLGIRLGRLVITDCWIRVTSGEMGDIAPDVY